MTPASVAETVTLMKRFPFKLKIVEGVQLIVTNPVEFSDETWTASPFTKIVANVNLPPTAWNS